jgi:hypothetical protein
MDGENLALFADVATGTHTLDLAQYSLYPISYTFFVKAVGKASIKNHISDGVAIVPRSRPTAQTLSLNPGARVARVKAMAPATHLLSPAVESVIGAASANVVYTVPTFVSAAQDSSVEALPVAADAKTDIVRCERSKDKADKPNTDESRKKKLETEKPAVDCE